MRLRRLRVYVRCAANRRAGEAEMWHEFRYYEGDVVHWVQRRRVAVKGTGK